MVVIIEHNLDVIRNADWIIDLGPEGGEEGGRIVAQGTPEQVAKNKKSYTGQALAQHFNENFKKTSTVELLA
jgi:excinuclease ABC subunit A